MSLWRFVEDGPLSRWQCALLDPWPHGFFTRQAPGREPHPLASGLGLCGRAFHLKQVHSDRVFVAPVEPQIEGDALWTTAPGTSTWVTTADCVPVLLADCARKAVAAVHAGWRGTAQQILVRTVEALAAAGSRPADLVCVLGPAISGPVYQVSCEVARQVCATVAEPERALLPDPDPERVRLDVREVNRQQALAAGIPAAQVVVSPVCTFAEPAWLNSYRREGAGRVQFSGIGLG